MVKNVSKIDAIIRIILAAAMFSCYFLLEGNLRYIAVLGLVFFSTALISFCPIYRILGLSTMPK